jgi:uncharacterized protein (DUF1800 family)
MAARSTAGGIAQPRAFVTGARGLPLGVAARLARTRALRASSAALQDTGCGIQTGDAVRFLEQATFGPSFATDPSDPNYGVSVAHLLNDFGSQLCFEGWLQQQFNAPVLFPDDPSLPSVGTNYTSPGDPGACNDPSTGGAGGGVCWSPQNRDTATCNNINGVSTCNRDNYTAWVLQNEFFSNALTGGDQLRQRVAWALHEIDVVSQLTITPASWMTPYVQLFDRDAFGNYRQLMYDVTVNPAMGQYLNMRGNSKANVNENYAREIMQLFTVGLNELNDDGTVPTDDGGNPIPTYDQSVITNLARVFTGWDLDAQIAAGIANYRDPMIVVSGGSRHDTNPKTLLDGQVVNDGAVPELNEALDIIFNHHNVGPFIGQQLIQKLVTSNPSPGYVLNVTTAFNTGSYTGPGGTTFGSGNRGDMQAVIAAVLLDPEARTAPDPIASPGYGHLREPVLFITNTLRALGIVDVNGAFTTDFDLGDQFLPAGANSNVVLSQDVFRPPSVFSYYPPSNQLAGSNLLAPEFAIQSTSTALAHVNLVYDFAYHRMPIDVINRPTGTWIDTTQFEPESAGDASPLIDDLNMRLMNGAMSQALYGIVQSAVQAIDETNATGRVREAIYLIASSSEYQVER